jgi:hypothetical protein
MAHHQHRHAYEEAVARYSSNGAGPDGDADDLARCGAARSPQELLASRYGVGPYDYECQGAKFIVASLSGVGIGANVRGGIVAALLAGLTSDRVVLFVNSSPVGHRLVRGPWVLSSCPRRDYQCFFFPPTPCALTHADIESAYSLTRSEITGLRRGNVPTDRINEKVWHLTLAFMPLIKIPLLAAERLYNHSVALLEPMLDSTAYVSSGSGNKLARHRRAVLVRAARRILRRNETRRPLYNYAVADLPIHHALAVFATRPNVHYQRSLLRISGTSATDAAAAGESKKDAEIDPELSVGLPIRGTYVKCFRYN